MEDKATWEEIGPLVAVSLGKAIAHAETREPAKGSDYDQGWRAGTRDAFIYLREELRYQLDGLVDSRFDERVYQAADAAKAAHRARYGT